MAIKPLRLNVYNLAKKYANTKDNPRGTMRVVAPVIKDNSIKREIGLRMIDAMIKRTLASKDKKGENFKEYSQSYINSTKFKIYKGRSKKVNLKLTGEMQASIDVLSTENNIISIYFDNNEDTAKAEGHVKGANYLPVRDFWGLPDEDEQLKIFEMVIKEYHDETLMQKIEFQNEPIAAKIGEQEIEI
jgi:hypothetical protein